MAATKQPQLKTKECPECGGTGEVPSDGVGAVLREQREEKGITAVDMAAHCNISTSFLFDLERDNRRWTNTVLAKYQSGLEELSNGNRG